MGQHQIIAEISQALQSSQDPIKAEKMAAYMKDRFPFYGVPAPQRTAILRPIWHKRKPIIKSHIVEITEKLWALPQREYQMIAMELTGKCKSAYTEDNLEHISSLITQKSWWDTVDFLASTIIGHILSKDSTLAKRVANEYMQSDNMWQQRTAILFQLKYKDTVDEELLYRLIVATKGSKEFFINKASGWALRQYSKYNPHSVGTFIASNKDWMTNLSIREGSKYL